MYATAFAICFVIRYGSLSTGFYPVLSAHEQGLKLLATCSVIHDRDSLRLGLNALLCSTVFCAELRATVARSAQ